MSKHRAPLRLGLAVGGVFALAACGSPEAGPEETPAPVIAEPTPAAPPTPAALPAVDRANAQQFVADGAALEPLDFEPTGSTTVEGTVQGEAAPVYAVPAAAGQTVTVTFQPANANLYINVSDATDHSGAALHRGEVDGAVATLTADRDMTFIIMPFQPRAMARRGETGTYTLTVARD